MRKTTLGLGALVAIACAGAMIAYGKKAQSADHLDSPAATMDPAADINDVYSWMDGNNMILAMTVFPNAKTVSKFSDKIQYVFHTTSAATFGGAAMNTDVICTFAADQTAQCWAGTDEYVKGNASASTGLASTDGKFKVFAGLRGDPFFFNLAGFRDTVDTVKSVKNTLMFNTAGCPALDVATSDLLKSKLSTDPNSTPPGGVAKDFFGTLNGLAIVVSIDKTLVTKGGPIVSVWGSTNKAQ
jgi:hypothetical protein